MNNAILSYAEMFVLQCVIIDTIPAAWGCEGTRIRLECKMRTARKEIAALQLDENDFASKLVQDFIKAEFELDQNDELNFESFALSLDRSECREFEETDQIRIWHMEGLRAAATAREAIHAMLPELLLSENLTAEMSLYLRYLSAVTIELNELSPSKPSLALREEMIALVGNTLRARLWKFGI